MSFLKYIVLLFFVSQINFGQDTLYIDLKVHEKSIPLGLTKIVPEYKPKVGAALSGGGARAISQIGTLKALHENNIPIDYIVGTSMGSVIGGLYASGYCLTDIDSILLSKDWNEFQEIDETKRTDLFVDQKITEDRAIFSIRFDDFNPILPTSINTGQKVLNFFNQLFINAPISGVNRFDKLLFDFKAVATDLVNGSTIVLQSGSISRALRASSSVSFLLPPVEIDSLLLADGGLVANVPAEVAKNSGADIVIALNTTSLLNPYDDLKYPWVIADQVVSIPINLITREQLESADVIIQPYLGHKKNNDFTGLDRTIQLGYEAVSPHLNSIEALYKKAYMEKLPTDEIFFHDLTCDPSDSLSNVLFTGLFSADSVSNHEIDYCLAREFEKGIYSKLSARIINSNDGKVVGIIKEINPIVKSVRLAGKLAGDYQSYRRFFKSSIMKPFASQAVLADAITYIREYKKKGFTLVTIKNIEFDQQSGEVTINLQEGIIDEIKIEGNTITNETVILRELPFEVGQKLMYDDLEEGLENLRITNLFDEVDINVKRTGTKNIIVIKVKERLSEVLRVGLKIDNEYFTQFLFDIRDENLFGSGAEGGLSFFSGPRNSNITFEQKSSRIFETYLTYNIKGFYSSTDISTYSEKTTDDERKFEREKNGEYKQRMYGASIALGTQVKKFGNIFGEFTYHRDQIDNRLNQPVGEYLINLASFRLGIKIDSQDKYPYPNSGFLIDGYYETAQKIFKSDIAYAKLYLDYTQYFTVHSIHTFRLHGSMGAGDETLPLSQQFSFGGMNNFLGYREYDFRGRQIFITSLEYRLKLPVHTYFDSYFKVRYDLGSIWPDTEKIKFKNFRHGIGATLSFDTPVGPADFSIAKSFLFKEQFPKSYISWGETFFYFNIGFYY